MKNTKAKTKAKKTVKKPAKKTVARKSKPKAVHEKPAPVIAVEEPESKEMTTEEYVKANQADLHYTADVQWREDKEGDYAHKGYPAILAIDWAIESDGIDLTDYSAIRDEMESDGSHPITKLIWRKPKM